MRITLLGLTTAALLACNGDADEAGACTTPPPASCAPLYEPTFDQLFARTLQPSCGVSGSSCHASEGRQGGLAFASADESYDLLVSRGRVKAGDPACSEVMVRVLSTGRDRMPPGRALDPGAQCALSQWIANGAKR